MKKALLGLLVLIMLSSGYLALVPGPLDSAAYRPPPAPALTGVLAPNDKLKTAELIGRGQVVGAEDVDVDAQGRVYGGTADGRILRIDAQGRVETFADTGGRPLGLHFDREGNLIVCDAVKGLLSVNPRGEVRVLLTAAEGLPFGFTDDLDIAADGTIYFSDASSRHHMEDHLLDGLGARPYGRLIRFDPQSGRTEVLLKDLYFANGVALSSAEDFVLVCETFRYRIVRYWLKGPRRGQHEIWADNLPGFPDGISGNRRGIFWVALMTVRKDLLDLLHPYPWAKNLMARLPRDLLPKPRAYGLVLAMDEAGRIVRSLHDTDGDHLQSVTSVQEHDGFIYLGTLTNDRIGRLPVGDAL
ncbi:MAG: SMP-30/gluconolactonase/LRE family protein [Desulfosarcina sp.]|nr:SMP-30/gluconolactonase/LRE family protein [Desulfobacterales bacterium]